MMTRRVPTILVVTTGLLLVASIAFAQCGLDPTKSTLGVGLFGNLAASIRLTGRNTSAPGSPAVPTGAVLGNPYLALGLRYVVEAHDCMNDPLAGVTVTFDFTQCLAAGGDIEISCDQSLNPGQSYVAPGLVTGTTDSQGRFGFVIQGAAASTLLPGMGVVSSGLSCQSTTACTNTGCARVYFDGILDGSLRVTAWDQNASSAGGRAVTGADAAIIAAEVARKTIVGFQKQRSDVNQNGNVEGGDAATVAAAAVLSMPGSYPVATGPYCP